MSNKFDLKDQSFIESKLGVENRNKQRIQFASSPEK